MDVTLTIIIKDVYLHPVLISHFQPRTQNNLILTEYVTYIPLFI